MTRPDDPVNRRRALAARVVTLAVSVELAAVGATDLKAPVPTWVHDIPDVLRQWASQIERTRP